MTRIVTITSGKGGVGKTTISLNLSLALASQGFKVCLFDADLGLANVSILTGLYPEKDLASVISGKSGINDILIKKYHGIDIIPGSNGVEEMANLTPAQADRLIGSFLNLDAYDFFIFDTSAGISSQVISFCLPSHEILLVVTTEPTSLTDAYAMLKVISKYKYTGLVKVIINQVKTVQTARKAYAQLKKTADRFLDIRLEPLGIMVRDKTVQTSVFTQTPCFLKFPYSPAPKCIRSMAEKLINGSGYSSDMPLEQFWRRCFSIIGKFQKNKDDTATDNDRPNHSKDASSEEKTLAGIAETLHGMMDEIRQIKTILAGRETVSRKKAPDPSFEPGALNNVVDFDSRQPRGPSTVPAPGFSQSPGKREPIVRGRLRSPTQKELAHWNEYENPVLL